MKYSSSLKPNSTIGVVAPSAGCVVEPYLMRIENAIKKFNELGHKVVLCDSLYKYFQHRSADAQTRAKEFMDMYLDDKIDVIFSAAGGEFMTEILPYVDFEKLKSAKPKYFIGFSDNTTLTYTLAVNSDVAAIYGNHFPEYGMSKWHETLNEQYEFLLGKRKEFKSQDMYEIQSLKKEEGMGLAGYNLTEKSDLCVLTGEKEVDVTGRLIGGCTDILLCILGTEFDKTKEFLEKYKEDGFIWFLESCDLNVCAQTRAMWQLKHAGYFKYCKAIMIGRPRDKEEWYDIDYKQANLVHLKDLNVPVIINADFGHVAPSIPMVSGAVANVKFKDDKLTIKYELR